MNYQDFKAIHVALQEHWDNAAEDATEHISDLIVAILPTVEAMPIDRKDRLIDNLGLLERLHRNPPNFNIVTPSFIRLVQNRMSEDRPDFLYAVLGALAYKLGSVALSAEPRLSLEIPLQIEVSSYAAWDAAESKMGATEEVRQMLAELIAAETSGIVRDIVDSSDANLTTARKAVEMIERNLAANQEATVQAQTRLTEVMGVTSGAQKELDEATKSFRDLAAQISIEQGEAKKRAAELEATVNKIEEKTNTLSVQNLWDQRARNSGTAFWISASVLAVFLLVIPVIAIICRDGVIAALIHMGSIAMADLPENATNTQLAAAALGKLVIITVPLALYFWIIRILVRFNLHSLAMLEDARQRHTMMDTYFHLIGRQAASVEDRALILNALFRPTPGQGGESVDPPNFLELVDKGFGGKG